MNNIQEDLNRGIQENLNHISKIRKFWSVEEDPGPGDYPLQDGYILRVLEWEELKKGKRVPIRTYLISRSSDRRNPITLSFDWQRFSENLSKRDEVKSMAKPSIHDKDLREKIKLKCKNDWNYDLSEDQISMCIIEMEEQRLSLFHDQLWPNHRRWKDRDTGKWMSRITWDKAINGYRAIAHRSGRFAGVDAAEFQVDENGNLIARVTVYALDAMGRPRPYVGEARFDEFVQLVDEYDDGKKTGNRVPNNQWSESPRNQLAIAAERQALRKAFQELDGEPKTFTLEPEPPLEQTSRDQAPEPPLEQNSRDQAPEPPEPPLEDSRGIPATPRKISGSKSVPAQKNKSENRKEESGGNKLKYVGIPKGGFQPFKKYNDEERIIMVRTGDGVHYLALDSGLKVAINSDGYEVERSNRSDKTEGGRKWKDGDTYFDNSIVEATASSKKDDLSLWLALNNGHKVLLDRWGKEKKKKERKKDINKSKPTPTEPAGSAPAGADVEVDCSDRARSHSNDESSSAATDITRADGDASSESGTEGNQGMIDPESVDTVEMMRKITAPLLKKWLKITGRSMSPKAAYKEFTGVILSQGQAMNLDDYKVLYDCLEEALQDA